MAVAILNQVSFCGQTNQHDLMGGAQALGMGENGIVTHNGIVLHPAVLLPRKLGLETGATNIKICLEPDSSHAIKEFYMSDDIYPNFLKTMVQANHPQELLRFDRYQKSHENPQGPGDARPTARQIILDENMEGQLVGTTILVTGCSSGIGIETARALAVTGANLVLAVRDLDKAKRVLEDFASTRPALDPEQFELLHMDLNSLDSVRRAAAEFLERHSKLHILINNAGIGGVSPGQTVDGFESHFGVNHLGHFLLFQLLKSTLLRSSTPSHHSRVISVSSLIHRYSPVKLDDYNFQHSPYDPAIAYASSKSCNIWFANELERRYAGKGLHGISLHPGGIETGLQRFHAPDYLQLMQQVMIQDPDIMKTFKSLEQGAATTVLAAIGRSFEGKGGVYLDDCAVAKPWLSDQGIAAPGYAPWAFDEAGQEKLWKDSLTFVGLTDENDDKPYGDA